MRITRSLQYFAAALACLGTTAPQLAFAAAPAAAVQEAPAKVTDVMLHADNLLAGQLVDPQGAPLAGAKVTVSQGNWTVGETTTTAEGVFAVRHLRSGVYTVDAGGTQGVYRVWTANTAPPAAKPAILMVQGEAARGQFVPGLLGPLGNPWVLAGIVGAAIAIPIALDSSNGS